jgi:ATP-dependent Lhr-like helicase
LAAFLWGLDRLATEPCPTERTHRTRLIYLSPLRALAVDVEKNLRAPLMGIRLAAERLGIALAHDPVVGMRTGDTPADERRKLVRNPPDLLITTPESLYLMLTSQARETLAGVEAVIVDEIHAVAATKRGSHLALTLERLDEVADRPPQRIGLSATQRPLDEIARFLGGFDDHGAPRAVTVVDAGVRKELDLEVIVPVDDMGALGEIVEPGQVPGAPDGVVGGGAGRRSIWPSVHPRLLELIQQHRSTIIFTNARRLSERLATRLNELAATSAGNGGGAPEFSGGEAMGAPPAAPELVMAHHGSLSRERRLEIEDRLKSGELRAIVATSSLELGIDMGAVDLVIQVESPGAVSRGLQRIGRAGHQVGEPSRGKLFPKHRNDLLEAAVVVQRMRDGLIEPTRYPRNPLDVLAQQIVAMAAMDTWPVVDLARVVRRAAPFHDLSDEVLTNVVDLLAGRYPSDAFAELRPRVVWDRTAGERGEIRGRAGAQRLAVTSGGTIPDRGLYGVFLPDGTRVGELDEEMVYESRPGESFLLGASTWKIEDITHDRVVVTPAPGRPGKMPFWHGDGPGRPLELGRAVGEFVRHARTAPRSEVFDELRHDRNLDELAATNLLAFLDEQAAATGVVPDDRTIVVERFRDEVGDWRICLLSPFGARVHAPWGMAIKARLAERWGDDVELIWSDDGIVLRLPEAVEELPLDAFTIDPDEIDELVVSALPGTALFAARFRECATRALLLPRRRPDRRTPLWQQRQKAADLLAVAGGHPDFPILLETTRECVTDVFDLPALRGLLRDLRSRTVRLVPVDTRQASPMAQSLLFGWISVYMYEGDAPLAERRATALSLDRDLLRELLGAEELRELLDADVLAALERELQRLAGPRHPARDADELHDLLRVLGPLTVDDLGLRAADGADVAAWVDQLAGERRVFTAPVAGEERVVSADDAARLRDALGVAIPLGLPAAYTEPVERPLVDLVARHARTHGPFTTAEVAGRLGVAAERVASVLAELDQAGRVVRGEFRPGGTEREWCDVEVLRQLRRRTLAALRREIEPVEAEAYARFLIDWQGVGSARRGIDGLVEVLGTLQGASIPASVLEADVLPARLRAYSPADLDALCAAGETVWVGAGALGSGDGRVRLLFRDQAAALLGRVAEPGELEPVHEALVRHLRDRGASFWPELVRASSEAGLAYDDATVLAALWDLVWAGLVTSDTVAPLRAFLDGPTRGSAARARQPRPGRLARLGPPAGSGRWYLVADLVAEHEADAGPVAATVTAAVRAQQLLERYGVLVREAVLGEGTEGGFAGVYPVLKAMEERGQVRRGYFVDGLGGAQFALPGAVDRLRAARTAGAASGTTDPFGEGGAGEPGVAPTVLAAADPAQPYGATLPWPDVSVTARPGRNAGAHVMLAGGMPLAYVERGGRSVIRFAAGLDAPERVAEALRSLVVSGRHRSLQIGRVDGEPVRESDLAPALRAAGFVDGYRGLVLRARGGTVR